MKHLGKKLKVGDVFESTSNRMQRNDFWGRKQENIGQKVYQKGDQDYFTKGKRRYFCQVFGISRTTTGRYCWPNIANGLGPGPRYWQFTYVVKVIEN